jgi:hypothetical protein
MGFDFEHRRRVMRAWRKASAQTSREVLEALKPGPGLPLHARVRKAFEAIASHGKSLDLE